MREKVRARHQCRFGGAVAVLAVALAVASLATTAGRRSLSWGQLAKSWNDDRVRLAMADLRLLYPFLLDHAESSREQLPMTAGKLVSLDPILDQLASREASAVRVTLRDPWGRALLYWSDGESMMVLSPGQNGRLERKYERVQFLSGDALKAELCSEEHDERVDDVVYIDGVFCWPQANP